MKKLLALVLVLCVASLANAVIVSPMTIVDLGGGLFGIELTSGMSGTPGQNPQVGDGSGGYWALIGVQGGSIAAAIKPPTVGGNMGMSTIEGDASDLGFDVASGRYGQFVTGATGAWTQAAGVYADSFTVLAGVTKLELYSFDDGGGSPNLVDTYIIPEPATIAVLGLGGLLLRRKK